MRRVGGPGIAGLLMAGGVLSDAVLASQTAGRPASASQRDARHFQIAWPFVDSHFFGIVIAKCNI